MNDEWRKQAAGVSLMPEKMRTKDEDENDWYMTLNRYSGSRGPLSCDRRGVGRVRAFNSNHGDSAVLKRLCVIAKSLALRQLSRAAVRQNHRSLVSHPADEEFAFVNEFLREMSVQVEEKLLMTDYFLSPGGAIHPLQFFELLLRKI